VLRHDVHGSGSPVPWDIERCADHRELLALVHAGHGASVHWAARIDRATHRMTHISAGPVLRSADFYTKVRGAALRCCKRCQTRAQPCPRAVQTRLCTRDVWPRPSACGLYPTYLFCYNETMVRGGKQHVTADAMRSTAGVVAG